MRFSRLVFSAVAAMTFAAIATPAAAQWSPEQRTSFVNDCLATCRKNPNVPERRRPQCDDYCTCVMAEGQRLFSEQDFERINNDFIARRQTADVKRFQELAPVCNRKAFAPR